MTWRAYLRISSFVDTSKATWESVVCLSSAFCALSRKLSSSMDNIFWGVRSDAFSRAACTPPFWHDVAPNAASEAMTTTIKHERKFMIVGPLYEYEWHTGFHTL